jgi:hypothetical protein
MVAFYLDPYVSFLLPVTLPEDALAHVKAIISKYCIGPTEGREVIQAFLNYHTSVGAYYHTRKFASDFSEDGFSALKEAYLKDNNLDTIPSNAQEAILECMAAGDPITWWKANGQHPKLVEIAVRILSSSPTAAPVERMNSMNKLVQSKARAALKHKRVVKLLYCYVNMRLLQKVDSEILSMVEEALLHEMDTLDRQAAQQHSGAEHVPSEA